MLIFFIDVLSNSQDCAARQRSSKLEGLLGPPVQPARRLPLRQVQDGRPGGCDPRVQPGAPGKPRQGIRVDLEKILKKLYRLKLNVAN